MLYVLVARFDACNWNISRETEAACVFPEEGHDNYVMGWQASTSAALSFLLPLFSTVLWRVGTPVTCPRGPSNPLTTIALTLTA